MTERKKKQKKTTDSPMALMSPSELKEANERADKILSDSGADTSVKTLDLAPDGMEDVGDNLTDDQLLVLNAVMSDIHAEPEEEPKSAVYRKLYASFKRSGMSETKGDEQRFFKILKDPKFGEIVKVTGRGVIGTRIVSIADKMVELALQGDKTAIKWALEIFGIKKSKYDYYMESANERRPEVNIGEINFGDKTEKELAAIRNALLDVTDKAEITS